MKIVLDQIRIIINPHVVSDDSPNMCKAFKALSENNIMLALAFSNNTTPLLTIVNLIGLWPSVCQRPLLDQQSDMSLINHFWPILKTFEYLGCFPLFKSSKSDFKLQAKSSCKYLIQYFIIASIVVTAYLTSFINAFLKLQLRLVYLPCIDCKVLVSTTPLKGATVTLG